MKLAALTLLALLGTASLRAADPRVDSLLPRGGQRGTVVTLAITGARLKDAVGLVCFSDRIEVLEVKPLSRGRVWAAIRIAHDCPLGETAFLVRTRSGLSNLKTFQVGSLREWAEVEGNDSPERAQRIPLWSTVNGVLRRRDRDFYAVDVPARQRVSIELQGVRLGDTPFDARLIVSGPLGRIVASSDDTSLGRMDPLLSFLAPRSGSYRIEVVEANLGGSGRCWYRLHVGSFPRPSSIAVGAVALGESRDIQGPALEPGFVWSLRARRPHGGIWPFFPRDAGGCAPVALPLWVSKDPIATALDGESWVCAPRAIPSSWWRLSGARSDLSARLWRGDAIARDRSVAQGEGVLHWTREELLKDGKSRDFRSLLKAGTRLYLEREISTRVSQRVPATLSCGAAPRLWLNGKLLLEGQGGSSAATTSHTVPLPLRRGLNSLLVELQAGPGSTEFAFRLSRRSLWPAASKMSVPGMATGVIANPGEIDGFRFKAKKGQTLQINAFARRLRSELDPLIRVRDAKGKSLGSNDDAGGLDSRLRFRAPQSGEFLLSITDQLSRGGAGFRYALRVVPNRAGFTARAIVPRLRRTPRVVVPRGGRGAFLFRIPRSRKAEVFDFSPLPAKVVATTAPFDPRASTVPVVFEAGEKAPLGAKLLDVRTRGAKGKARSANYRHSVKLVTLDNDRPYITHEIERLPIAVGERLPFRVELVPPSVPIVKGSPMSLEVRVHRDQGFKGRVRLRMLWNPPGITSGALSISGSKTVGRLSLSASSRAQPGRWSIAVVGSATVGGTVRTASKLVPLEIIAPMVTAKISRARGEQGAEVPLAITLSWKLKPKKDCPARIVNLPRGVSTTFSDLGPGQTSLRYLMKLDKKAARGRHRGLLLRVSVPSPGGMIVHDLRGGELRIDRPLAPRKGSKGKAKSGRKLGTLSNPKTE